MKHITSAFTRSAKGGRLWKIWFHHLTHICQFRIPFAPCNAGRSAGKDMDRNQLVSATVELGLDLLEKGGGFFPFCKAIAVDDEVFVYSAASETGFTAEQAYHSVLDNVKQDIHSRQLKGMAFCFDSRVRISDSDEKVPAVEVEAHFKGHSPTIWHFIYKLEGGKAEVLEYFMKETNENLFT